MYKSDPTEIFNMYCAMKAHFTTTYDYIKYNGIVKISDRKRNDIKMFEKIARKFSIDEAKIFFAINLLYDPTVWIGNMNYDLYIDHVSYMNALSYKFKKEFKKDNKVILPYAFQREFIKSTDFLTEFVCYLKKFQSELEWYGILILQDANGISNDSMTVLDRILQYGKEASITGANSIPGARKIATKCVARIHKFSMFMPPKNELKKILLQMP